MTAAETVKSLSVPLDRELARRLLRRLSGVPEGGVGLREASRRISASRPGAGEDREYVRA